MKFKYPGISSGYAGNFYENQTLNSKFYAALNFCTTNPQLNEIIQLPQRIPRTGMFEELLNLETTNYKKAFETRTQDLLKEIQYLTNEINVKKSTQCVRKFINLGNLALRFGKPQAVIDSVLHDGANSLEVKLLKEISVISLQLSTGNPISTKNLISLTDNYLSSPLINEREKIMMLNQLIVSSYRHEQHRDSNQFLFYANKLLQLIENHETADFNTRLRCSIAYRGLAMVFELGENKQDELLKRAEGIAISLTGQSQEENILALENLYTCLQSVTKWHLHHQKYDHAEMYFKKMIEIDPIDSTGYSELSLYYIHQEKYHEAAENLKSAMRLGPPGTAMNTYYYAKCMEFLGKNKDCIDYLIETTSLDNTALSPWLDLFDIYVKNNDTDKAKNCANHILNSITLRSQLEDEEINTLHNFIN